MRFIGKAGLHEACEISSDDSSVRMCELAVDDLPEGWLMVDPWEATRDEYQPTAKVLDHFNYELNERLGGAARPDGSRVPFRIILLAGADLVQTMSTPGMHRIRMHEK